MLPTPDESQRALVAIRAGADEDEAAAYAGVDRDTWAQWMDTEFGDQVRDAQNELVLWAHGNIRRAASARPDLAREFIDRDRGRRELARLKAITHPGS